MTAAFGLGMFVYSMVCFTVGCVIIYIVIKDLK
jgi:hypothetical protein